MLDTLKLSLTDYEVRPDAPFEVQPACFNPATGETGAEYPLWRRGSMVVKGSKAFCNAEHFNVTLKPVGKDLPASIGCFVQFSVPKIANATNYNPADEKSTRAALKQLERDLKDSGVYTNIKSAALSRVDACKTVETSEPFQTYAPVLAALQGQRMAKRDYGTTFLWHNTQQEVAVYDKIAEMRYRKQSVAGLPSNAVRFEHRLLKGRKVQDALGMKTVNDLLSDFGHVEKTYGLAMQTQLFKFSVPEVSALSSISIRDQMQSARLLHGRQWFDAWLKAFAWQCLIDDKQTVLNSVEAVAETRMAASRARRKIGQIEAEAMAFKSAAPSSRTLGDLYEELRVKVLGA